MFCSANVTIYFSPIFYYFWIYDGMRIHRIHKAEIVPTRASPLRHSVRLSFSDEIISQSYINPLRDSRKRGLAITRWFIFLYFGEFEWEIPIRHYPIRDSSCQFSNNLKFKTYETIIIYFICISRTKFIPIFRHIIYII